MKAPLIILSGPSGSGKSTVVARLLADPGLPLRRSVSATTRAPRPSEVDGRHYHFWTRDQFQQEIDQDGFLEWARVHDQYYGTLRREVTPYRERGVGVLLEIDVQGAEQVRRQCPDALTIFLHPPSPEELERRLRGRQTETEASIQRRLANAKREMARSGEYAYHVVNDNLDRAVHELKTILQRHFGREAEACSTT